MISPTTRSSQPPGHPNHPTRPLGSNRTWVFYCPTQSPGTRKQIDPCKMIDWFWQFNIPVCVFLMKSLIIQAIIRKLVKCHFAWKQLYKNKVNTVILRYLSVVDRIAEHSRLGWHGVSIVRCVCVCVCSAYYSWSSCSHRDVCWDKHSKNKRIQWNTLRNSCFSNKVPTSWFNLDWNQCIVWMRYHHSCTF